MSADVTTITGPKGPFLAFDSDRHQRLLQYAKRSLPGGSC